MPKGALKKAFEDIVERDADFRITHSLRLRGLESKQSLA
jgi:hypothetical protein